MRHTIFGVLATILMPTAAIAADDAAFVAKAVSGGMMEVELGRHAAAEASDPEVRSFGERMAADHGKANRELAALAEAQGLPVPKVMNEEHQQMVDDLTAEGGRDFDTAYMKMMVEDHQADVAAFQREATTGNSKIDEWARATLPTLEGHLALAREIYEGMTKGAGADAHPAHAEQEDRGRLVTEPPPAD